MISFTEQGIKIMALVLHWSALASVAGVWIAAELAAWLARREGRDPAHVWRGLLWIVGGALLGGRLWYVLFPPLSAVQNQITTGWMLTHPTDLNQGPLAIWSGGFGFFGALLGGTIGLWRYMQRNEQPLGGWLNLAAVVLPLAQAIARLGSGAQQYLYGPPTDLPWGMLVSDKGQRIPPYTDLTQYPLETTRFHPVYLYETLFLLVLFTALLILYLRYRERFKQGEIALLYLAGYGVGRFLLESTRINVSLIAGINVSQLAALLTAAIALWVLWRRGLLSQAFTGTPINDRS